MLSYFSIKRVKLLLIKLLLFLITYGIFSLFPLANAQIFSPASETVLGNIAVAPVKLDGRILFEVTSPLTFSEQSEKSTSIYSVKQRVERIEKTLYNLLKNSDRNSLTIEASTLKNQTIISASDAKKIRKITIVTVTDLDAQFNAMPISELAEQGSIFIHQALIRAWQEREPKWLFRQSLIALFSLILLLIISKLSYHFANRFSQKSLQNQADQDSLRFLKSWSFPTVMIILWLPSISLILRLFPYTREWGILFLNSTVNLSFTLLLFLLSGKGLDVIYKQYKPSDPYQKIAFKTVTDLIWIVCIIIFIILIVSILLNQPPLNILAGFGAAGAVFLLISQDSLKGFVAGIELASNKMVALGDWIEMPKYKVNGHVIDISLLTVKVRNLDQSIVSIPSYTMVSESFINWKAMQTIGARRIMRAVFIDLNTIKICSEELINNLQQKSLISDIQVQSLNSPTITNLELFQTHVEYYLRSHSQIDQDLPLVVRQLPSHQYGVPIEIYCFTYQTNFSDYEAVQSDIFNHLFSVVNEFELNLFQSPSGEDFQSRMRPRPITP